MKVRVTERHGKYRIEAFCWVTPLITYYERPWWAGYWPLSLLGTHRWLPLVRTGVFTSASFQPESEGRPVVFDSREEAEALIRQTNREWEMAEGDWK